MVSVKKKDFFLFEKHSTLHCRETPVDRAGPGNLLTALFHTIFSNVSVNVP